MGKKQKHIKGAMQDLQELVSESYAVDEWERFVGNLYSMADEAEEAGANKFSSYLNFAAGKAEEVHEALENLDSQYSCMLDKWGNS